MRKLLLILAVLLLLTGTVRADDTAVTEMKTECDVAEDGSCQVVLQVSLKLSGDASAFSFPIAPNARDISVSGVDAKVSAGGKYTVVTIDRPTAGTAELTVRYRLPQTVTDLGNGQRFDLTLLYPDWPCPINRYSLRLELPGRFENLPTIVSGYYGDLIDNYLDLKITDGVIEAALNEKQTLQDHEAIRISLDLPAHYFDLRYVAGRTAPADRLLFLMLLVLSLGYWLIFFRSAPIRARRQAMPPEGGSIGAAPYLAAGRKPDFALTVVQWASLGYLTISRSRSGRTWLTRQIEMGNERREYEIAAFRTLFHGGDACGVRSKTYRRAKALYGEKTVNYWKMRVFRSSGNPILLRLIAAAAGVALCVACFDLLIAPKSWRWPVIAALALAGGLCCWLLQRICGSTLRRHTVRTVVLGAAAGAALLIVGGKSGQSFWMLLCVLFQLAVGFILRCGGKRTKAGRELASELLGFRRYLVSASSASFKKILDGDPQYFYRNLPYADALRVDRIFTNSFERFQLELCDWLDWEGRPARTARTFYTRYVRLMAELRGEREPLALRLRTNQSGRQPAGKR